mgnify:FL=1
MHNTQTALHRCIDSWLDNICDQQVTAVCFLDIRKCFDSIDHNILLSKLENFGIQNTELEWFSSYLKDRSQIVCQNNVLSKKAFVQCGVPPGSVLGPILFTIFINDISQNVHPGTCNLYADDTVVYCSGNSISEAQNKLQSCVSKLSHWYSNNKLSINASKSEVMIVNSRWRHPNDEMTITINGDNLNCVQCATYLGVKIDSHLSWNDFIPTLCKKISFKLQRLRRLAMFVPRHVILKIYVGTIQPCIDYAISVWGQTSNYNIQKIQRLQNYAARIICNEFDYVNCRGKDLIKSLNLMNVKQRIDYFTIILTFKSLHGLAPTYLSDEITLNNHVNQHQTRSHENNIYAPDISSHYSQQSLKYNGAILWNSLPSSLTNLSSLNVFKYHLKRYTVRP